MDRLKAMQSFRAVVERGGFAAASTALGISTATVSKQVAWLEARLGAQLLQRTSRRFSLTEAGERFLTDTIRLLDDLATAEARAADDAPRGVLRVNAPLTYGIKRLMPLVTQMMRDHPALAVEVHLDDRRRDLVGEGYDVTIRISERLADSNLIARRIGAIDHVVCAAPVYLAQHGEPKTPETLVGLPMLVYTAGNRQRRYRFASKGRITEVEVRAALATNTTLALRMALLDGAGIAVTPRFAVQDELAAGRLIPLLAKWSLPEHSVHALFHGGSYVPSKTRRFIELLMNERRRLSD